MFRLMIICCGVVAGVNTGEVRGDTPPFGLPGSEKPESYVNAGRVTAEIVDITKTGDLTLKVTYLKAEVQRNRGGRGGRGRGGRNVPRPPNVRAVPKTEEVKVTLIPGAKIKSQRALTDEEGKRREATAEDLARGQTITAIMVRAKSNPDQLSIHTAMIHAQPNYGGR